MVLIITHDSIEGSEELQALRLQGDISSLPVSFFSPLTQHTSPSSDKYRLYCGL